VTISEALDAVRSGKLVTRTAWHGELLLYLERAMSVKIDDAHPLNGISTGGLLHPFIALKAHSYIIPWSPQQEDLMGDDWSVVVT